MSESGLNNLKETSFELVGELVFSNVGDIYKKDIDVLKEKLKGISQKTITLDLTKVPTNFHT